jgi:hypothetical protein
LGVSEDEAAANPLLGTAMLVKDWWLERPPSGSRGNPLAPEGRSFRSDGIPFLESKILAPEGVGYGSEF